MILSNRHHIAELSGATAVDLSRQIDYAGCVFGCNCAREYRMTTKKMYRYTKDALLAFASLPSCQPRPDGIDPAIWRDSTISDVVEKNIAIPVVPPARGLVRRDSDLAYSKSPVDDIPEWRRPNGGGAVLQSGPRRKPYEEEPLGNAFSSSYPPRPSGPWVEQNGPIRPPHDRPSPNGPPGRWDRNGDRDRERGRLPQEWDADEGGPVGKGDPGPRPWVERDGLLGSGNRPPPQGHARVGRPVDTYQPSRPLIKTPMHGRREDTDVVNDETFGFLESSTDDRSDQERKRREAFEMMRKEQHKQLKEQKRPVKKSENSVVNRKHDENSLWDNISHQSPPHSPVDKTIVPPAPTPPRPAVPPGFSKMVQQRLNGNQTPLQQEDDAQGASNFLSKDASVKEPALLDSDKSDDSSSAHSSSSIADIKEVKCGTPIAKEMIIELDVVVDTKVVVTESTENIAVSGSLSSVEISSGKSSAGVPDMWNFSLEGQDADLVSDILASEDAGNIRKESLLDKLFGNAPPTILDDIVLPSELLRDEPPVATPDEDTWSGSLSKTSKFAHWFNAEEDKFTTSQTSSSKNFMSLFGSNEHADNSFSLKNDAQSTGALGSTIKPGLSVVLPMPAGPSLEDIEKSLTTMGEAPNTYDHIFPKNKSMGNSTEHNKPPSASPPVFMTCEDIEQALLAEAAGFDTNRGISRVPPTGAVAEPPKDAASASQHLLALLLKRPSNLNGGLDMVDANQSIGINQTWKNLDRSSSNVTEVHTLETLFGKAFMSELQSSEIPAAARMLSEEGHTRHESEADIASFPMHNEDFVHVPRSKGMDGPRDWLLSSGPGWNSMWPDSKDMEAGGFHPSNDSHLNHPVAEDFEDRMASAPPLPGLWNNTDSVKTRNHTFMDTLNGATPHFGGAPSKQALNDGLVKKNKPFPGVSLSHMNAPPVQRNQIPSPLVNANANSFSSHPAHRQPQAQGSGFNNNGVDMGFDGFTAPQHIQPLSHSFHGPISHPPNHLNGPPQILQRSQFHYGMVMQEEDVIKPQIPVGAGSAQAPRQFMHGQHQPNPAPPGGFLPIQSDFLRTNSKSSSTGGYGGVGSVERWFGMDGRRSGHMGPASVFPQAPLGVEGDMNLRY